MKKILMIASISFWTSMIGQSVEAAESTVETVKNTGVSGIWMLSNICYAGMKAQGNRSGWRILAFIFGLPGTLLTLLVVRENSGRAYGIDLSKK